MTDDTGDFSIMGSKLYQSDEAKPMSESKEVALWQERISMGKKSLDAWAEESGAKRYIKEYKGKFDIFFNGLKGRIPVPPINEVFAYVQSDIAFTYNRDPYITVNPKTTGSIQGAKLWEILINYWWRELKTKEEMEYEILDKDLVGYGWHKVGYAVNSTGTGEKLKIENETLYSKQLSWKDVIWNVGAKRPPEDCQWMAQRVVRPLDDIKSKFKAAKALEGTPHPDIDDETYKKSFYKDDIKVGVYWEIWDTRKKQILLIAEGLKDTYLAPPTPWPDYLDEFPFLMYWDFAIPGEARPMSAIAPWEAQILEEMVLLGQAINHSKRWNRQVFYNGGVLDDNVMDKYERGDDGAMIRMAGKLGPEDFRVVDYGQLPTDFYMLMDRLQAIKRNINGQPEFVRGGVTKTGTRTVGELQLMEQGVKGRQERKVDRLETHLENISRHMMAHLKANFDEEQVLKITGEMPEELMQSLGQNFDPQTGTVKFSPQEIQGEYDVEVKAGSTLPMDKQHRTRVLETILQSVAQVVSQGPMSQFMNTLIQEILREYEIKSLEVAYQQDVQQAQQAQAQAQQQQNVEQQKIAAETAKRSAQAQQVGAQTEITSQEAQLGPQLRALLRKMEKGGSEQKSPSESISFKDLPEEGKIAMAAQAGIHLTSPVEIPVAPVKNGGNGGNP